MLRTMRSEFGQRLFDARIKAKKTQQQVAAACGMGQSNYAKLERKGNGSVNTAALAKFLKINVQWLAYGIPPIDEAATPTPEPDPICEPPLSHDAVRLGRWLDKIKDPDVHWRTANAAMAVVTRVVDGPPIDTSPKQPETTKKRRGERSGR